MEYVLSRKAEEDVVGIFLDGIEKFGLAQADKYHSKLEACFEFLASNPFAAAERKEFRPVVRIHPVGVHLVIYRMETPQMLRHPAVELLLRLAHLFRDSIDQIRPKTVLPDCLIAKSDHGQAQRIF